jgi:mitotic spindle assembly checkpoint protein MAD1
MGHLPLRCRYHEHELTTEIETLNSTIEELNAANSTLDGEVTELMKRVASGEFNPARERCLELAANPAAKVKAVRAQQLEELKAENAALLERLAGAGEAVPLMVYEKLVQERDDMKVNHEKRLQRLKEVSWLISTPWPSGGLLFCSSS